MSEEMTLGYTLNDGTEVDLQVGVHDWNGQCDIVENTLLTMHKEEGHTEEDLPGRNIMAAAYCVRTMRDELIKLSEKVDQLIDENLEMAGKLETAVNGLNVVVELNKSLGEQNEKLRQLCLENGLIDLKQEAVDADPTL